MKDVVHYWRHLEAPWIMRNVEILRTKTSDVMSLEVVDFYHWCLINRDHQYVVVVTGNSSTTRKLKSSDMMTFDEVKTQDVTSGNYT